MTIHLRTNLAKAYMPIASEKVSHLPKVLVVRMAQFLSMFLSLKWLISMRWLRIKMVVHQQADPQQACPLRCLLLAVCLLPVVCQAVVRHHKAILVWTCHLRCLLQEECLLPVV